MEAGIGFSRIEAVVRQQKRIVEIDGRIIALIGGGIVDDLAAGWTWRELLPRHMDGLDLPAYPPVLGSKAQTCSALIVGVGTFSQG